jgi:hypothetical protein
MPSATVRGPYASIKPFSTHLSFRWTLPLSHVDIDPKKNQHYWGSGSGGRSLLHGTSLLCFATRCFWGTPLRLKNA